MQGLNGSTMHEPELPNHEPGLGCRPACDQFCLQITRARNFESANKVLVVWLSWENLCDLA